MTCGQRMRPETGIRLRRNPLARRAHGDNPCDPGYRPNTQTPHTTAGCVTDYPILT